MAAPESKPSKLHITFVVTGQSVEKDVNANQPLHALVSQVLAETKNTGQPADQWVLTYNSRELDQKKTFEGEGIPTGAKLFLTIRSGRGGFLE